MTIVSLSMKSKLEEDLKPYEGKDFINSNQLYEYRQLETVAIQNHYIREHNFPNFDIFAIVEDKQTGKLWRCDPCGVLSKFQYMANPSNYPFPKDIIMEPK